MSLRNRRFLSAVLLVIAVFATPLTTFAATAPGASTPYTETEGLFAVMEDFWLSLVALLPFGEAVGKPAPPAAPSDSSDFAMSAQEPDGEASPSISPEG